MGCVEAEHSTERTRGAAKPHRHLAALRSRLLHSLLFDGLVAKPAAVEDGDRAAAHVAAAWESQLHRVLSLAGPAEGLEAVKKLALVHASVSHDVLRGRRGQKGSSSSDSTETVLP